MIVTYPSFTQHAASLHSEITEITERRKDIPQPPYATFINFLLKVVIKNQLFQCFFYLCDTLRINNMDKSFYITININNMGGGSPFSSSSAFIHPYGQRRLSAPPRAESRLSFLPTNNQPSLTYLS